tara:strand:- start:2574 stop:3440 length:867 start_codon:yes stop_codon:yes gene_type:complete
MSPRLGLGNTLAHSPKVGGSLLLDKYGDGIYGAYSLRQLRTGVTNVCQCVRDSDTENPRDFTATELTDGTLTSFGAGTTVRVKTLYDQSGSSPANDATQTTLTSCPTLVISGTAQLDGNGLPWMNFDGTDDIIPLNTALPDIDIGNCSSFVVGKFDVIVSNQDVMFSLGTTSGSKRWYAPTAYASQFNYGYAGTWNIHQETQDTNVHLFTTIAGSTQGDWQPFIDGVSKTNKTLVTGGSSGFYGIGGVTSTTGFALDGKVQEAIIYSADKSVDRSSIESDILAYYSLD